MKRPRKVQISLLLRPKFKDHLAKLAEEDGRSLSGFAELGLNTLFPLPKKAEPNKPVLLEVA
jgi:hypothetical protein